MDQLVESKSKLYDKGQYHECLKVQEQIEALKREKGSLAETTSVEDILEKANMLGMIGRYGEAQ